MDSQNQDLIDYMEPLFDIELYDSPVFVPEIGDVQSPGFDVDDYSVLSGTQGRNILPSKSSREEESDMTYKRLKLGSPTQQCFYDSVPESSSPLGLRLKKTPSFLDLVESKLSHSNTSFSMLSRPKSDSAVVSVPQSNGKAKASNFSASLLRIGSWELTRTLVYNKDMVSHVLDASNPCTGKVLQNYPKICLKLLSRYDGQLVAKCYFAKRKLVWEVLDDGLKRKIEVQWSDITALKATYLLRRPLFSRETNPQPRKHTLWKATSDFTDGQASIVRRHFLQFPQGTLQKHYEKLLQLDNGLFLLSKNPYPLLDSAYFYPDDLERQNSDNYLSGLMGQGSIRFEELLESGPSDEYLELLRCFTLSRTSIHPRRFSLDQTVASSETFLSTLGILSSSDSLPIPSLILAIRGSACSLDDETSVSMENISPSEFVSLPPPSMPTFNKSNLGGSCYSVEKGEVRTNLWRNNHNASGQGNPNSNFKVNSVLDLKPNCWVSQIQTNQTLADSSEDNGYRSSLDDYLSAFSYLGKVNDNLEEYGAVFVVEDDDATLTRE
ncbi:hypothetical protein IFM89_030653 [Coptis chinensis]|uniref:TRF2/HOY1 PH-like domain-containing protein n=1 Tax=Coptis chinensis TaxID=261450 RepID=A0A835IYE3_9MAGN|nr:hypothetical protein IFM89_030653 [Coptis chinensis]